MNWIALLISIVCIVIFYVIGHLIISVVNSKKNLESFYSLFLKILVGCVSVITAYAIFKSNANTILWGILIVASIWLFLQQKPRFLKIEYKNFYIKKQEINAMLFMFVITVLFFLMRAYLYYNNSGNNHPHEDYAFYAQIAMQLQKNGIENYNNIFNVINQNYTHTVPYHYFELWLLALLKEFVDLPSIEVLYIIICTFFSALYAIGMQALIQLFTHKFIWRCVGVFAVFFIPIIAFNYSNFPLGLSTLFPYSFLLNPKVVVVGIFFMWVCILLATKSNDFIFPLLCLPIINVGLAPGVFAVLFLYGIYFMYKRKYATMLKFYMPAFVIGIFILGFYVINTMNAEPILSQSRIFANITSVYFYKILQFIIYFLAFNILFWVVFLVLILRKNKRAMVYFRKSKHLFYFTIIITLVSFIIKNLFVFQDSFQFFALPAMMVAIPMFLLVLFSFLSIQNKIVQCVGIVYCIGISIFCYTYYIQNSQVRCKPFPYSKEYTQAILEETQNKQNTLIAHVRPESEYKTQFFFTLRNRFLHTITDNYKVININVFDYPKEFSQNSYVQTYIKQTPFYKYVLQNNGINTDVMQSQLFVNFLKEYNITYVVAQENLPILKNMIDTVFVDSKTQENFIVLNHKKNL